MDVGQSQLTESRISGVLVSLLFFPFYCLVGLPKLPCGKFPRASSNKKIVVEKFDRNVNFGMWQLKMEAILVQDGVDLVL